MRTEDAQALRAWARGMYPTEAGVELLLRAFDGRFASSSYPWVKVEDDGTTWVDVEELFAGSGAFSGGERHVLNIVGSLLSGQHPVSLSDALPGLSRVNLDLVLAALAHAGGSHQHSNVTFADDGTPNFGKGYLPTLHPWSEA